MEALAGASFNLHHKLRAREVTAARPGASTHRSRRFYESIYPTKTVDHVTVPDDVHVKRFTDDGRYLLCFSRNQRELVVYRYVGGRGVNGAGRTNGAGAGDRAAGRRAEDGGEDDAAAEPSHNATASVSDGDPSNDTNDENDDDARCRPDDAFESHFEHAYSRPLVIDADLLHKDFALTVLDGDYVVVASSTQPEARQSDENNNDGNPNPTAAAAAASGRTAATAATARATTDAAAQGAAAVERARNDAARERFGGANSSVNGAGSEGEPGGRASELPASPSMDVVAFHLVRLHDGKLCDRMVFRDDYIRLKRAQGVSAVRESEDSTLLTILSLRRQAFHAVRCRRRRPECSRSAGVAGTGRRWGAFDGVTQGFGGGEGLGVDGGDSGDGDTQNEDGVEEVEPVPATETAEFVALRPPVGSRCAPDDDAPLRAQDAAEARWHERRRGGRHADASDADDEGDHREHGQGGLPSIPAGATGLTGWCDPKLPMFAGIKQKIMTRAFLEARRRDDEEWQLYHAEVAAAAVEEERARRNRVPRGFLDTLGWGPGFDSGLRGGGVDTKDNKDNKDDDDDDNDESPAPPPERGSYGIAAGQKRKRASMGPAGSFSLVPAGLSGASASAIERPRNRHVSAFYGRYWYYAEWMCVWHCAILDEEHVALRMGSSDDVLAWGRRVGANGGAHGGGSNRCPQTVLVAVVRLADGAVVHVGDLRGEHGGLIGVKSTGAGGSTHERAKRNVVHPNAHTEVTGEEPPAAEGSEWMRLAAGTTSAPAVPAVLSSLRFESTKLTGTGTGGESAALTTSSCGAGGGGGYFEWPKTPAPTGHWCGSPYFDPKLFDFDRRAVTPDERPRAATEVSLRFSAARGSIARVRARLDRDKARIEGGNEGGVTNGGVTNKGDDDDEAWVRALVGGSGGGRGIRSLRFKLPPSAAAATQRMKRSVTHVFHPVFPFAMSVSQAFMQPQVVSFHFRE